MVLDRGERLDYDSLIVACGARDLLLRQRRVARSVSCGLKTLADAVDLRNRIFGAFEEAERATDPTPADEWLTFVVVGGGPTGVEIAGELAIIVDDTVKRRVPRIDPERRAGDPARRRRPRRARVQREALGEGRARASPSSA